MSLSTTSLFLSALTLIAASASAHDGDGKILDRQPPYRGEAWRRATSGSQPGVVFQSSGVELMSWLPLNTFGTNMVSGASGWGYVSPSGREYAMIGLSNGTGFVEVTDPANAQIVSVIPGPGSLWHDVRVYQNYAYTVSEGGSGIQIINLANIDSGQVTLANTITTGGDTATHTVCIDEASGFLYRAGGGSNGLRIYNLAANPTNPPLVAQWQTRYVHEVTVKTYTSGPYAGRQIAFCCSGFNGGWVGTGLDILDVTNKLNIVPLAHVFWPNAGYSHQCWPSDDMRYLYIDDELDESSFGLPTTTLVFDIQDLANPVNMGTFTNGNQAIGHNLYVKGNLLFEANYRSGLRVFDISNPIQGVEVAWFDTWTADDAPQFNSLWNVYPYFPSGTVIGTDIEQGLFVWRVAGYPPPTTYCQAKQNSLGCTPAIGFSGSPSMSQSAPFDISASNVINNKNGLLFYGLEPSSAPFHGGTLCLAAPIVRTPVQSSGGSASGSDCTGTFHFDFNAYLQSGHDPALGAATHVRCQYWSRDPNDPSGFTDSLTNALWFSVGL